MIAKNFNFVATSDNNPSDSKVAPAFRPEEERIKEYTELAAAKLEEYCPACGHEGLYQYWFEFNIDAASSKESPQWKTGILRSLEKARQKKRRLYFLKKT